MTRRQLSVLITLGVIWGASFLFIKVAVDAGGHPLGVSAARTAFGSLALLPLAFLARKRAPRRPGAWALLALLGFVNFALPWTLFATAAEHAPSGASSIANSCQPLWSALIVIFVARQDRLTGLRAIGLAVGFGGVLVLMGGDLASTDTGGSVAILLMLVATLCYAASGVTIRVWLSDVPALFLAATQIGFAALYLVPLAAFRGEIPGPSLGANAVLALLLLGLANSGIAVIGYMWLIGQVGPVRAAVVTYLMPPIGVTLGWLVLDEPVGWNLLGGLALVVFGIALVQRLPLATILRPSRWAPSTVRPPAPSPAEVADGGG
jgi:drug/metabolite transporter (DMT)-like permease